MALLKSIFAGLAFCQLALGAVPSPVPVPETNRPSGTPPTFLGRVANGTQEDLISIINAGNPDNYTAFWEIGTSHLADLSTIQPVTNQLGKRVSPCNSYNTFRATQIQKFWNAWTPVSACLYTGYDPAGGYPEISWTFQIEEDEGFSISLNIADLINAQGSFGASYSYSVSDSYACNVPGNSVGQIWAQQEFYWTWIETQTCRVCNGVKCGSWNGVGVGKAPINGIYQVGCSVGNNKVDCEACHNCVKYT